MNHHTPLIDAAIVAMLAIAGALGDPLGQDVFENRELLYLVMFGGLGGGYVATAILSRPDATRRQLASRLFTSSVISILFTPWLMEVLHFKITRGVVLGFSATVAILGVGVIRATAAAWTAYFVKRFSPPDGGSPTKPPTANP